MKSRACRRWSVATASGAWMTAALTLAVTVWPASVASAEGRVKNPAPAAAAAAADHDGRYADSLAELREFGYVAPNPDSDVRIALRAGLQAANPDPASTIAGVKFTPGSADVVLGYLDGHVERVSGSVADARLQQQTGDNLAAWRMRAELEYEIQQAER